MVRACFCENTPSGRHEAAWRLLYEILEKEYCLSHNEIKVGVTSGGKPYLSSHPHIHFSLSHSEQCAVCAVSDHLIGIDVEKVRPVSSRMKKKRLNLPADSDDITAIRRWTIMESYGKMLGCGVGKRSWKDMMEDAEGKCCFRDMSFLWGTGYVITVCYETE